MNYPTHEQMKLIVESNGWTTLWSSDYWVRSEWLKPKSGVNVDWAGTTLVGVYEQVMKNLETTPVSKREQNKRWF